MQCRNDYTIRKRVLIETLLSKGYVDPPLNLCHRLRRLFVSYKGEISLHLSFLGIEKEAALVIDNEIQSLLDLGVHFERLHPGPFN